MVHKKIKNIFLSASIPLPDRDIKFINSADIIAIRDAVLALATNVLPHHRIIWGGHPSITPLINYVMEKLNIDVQSHLKLYQSAYFQKFFPEDNNKFNNIVTTKSINNSREQSLEFMRNEMLSNDFSAGIFIGGMEGVLDEYELFIKKHPNTIVLPIASTGAAAQIIYDKLSAQDKNSLLTNEYSYTSLFQQLLINKLTQTQKNKPRRI